jgi:hypothetical protein
VQLLQRRQPSRATHTRYFSTVSCTRSDQKIIFSSRHRSHWFQYGKSNKLSSLQNLWINTQGRSHVPICSDKQDLYNCFTSKMESALRWRKKFVNKPAFYVRIRRLLKITNKSASLHRWVNRAARTTGRKVFRLLCRQHRQLRVAMLGASSSRTRVNYRQRSGARYQLAPEYGNSRSRPATSSISATRRSQQRSVARQQLRLRSWLWFYDNNSATSTTSTASTPHQIKAKFSSSKSRFLFTFRRTRHSGAPPWKIILHIIDFEKLWKP